MWYKNIQWLMALEFFLPEHTKPPNSIRKTQKSKWISVVGTSNVCPVNFLITFKIVETLLLWYWLNEQWFLSQICFKKLCAIQCCVNFPSDKGANTLSFRPLLLRNFWFVSALWYFKLNAAKDIFNEKKRSDEKP